MPRTTVRSAGNGSVRDIPPPVPSRMTDSEFENLSIMQAMKKMTPEDWSDKLLYVYRLRPMCVNKKTGTHNYTDKLMESIDEDWLKATYGGGIFQLILNATNPTRTLIKGQVKIAGEPVLRTDEVLVTQAEKDGTGVAAAPAAGGQSVDDTIKLIHAVKGMQKPEEDASGKALNTALDLVAAGAKKGMEISALEAGNKTMSIEKIFDLALKAREPREDPKLAALYDTLLKRALEPTPTPKEKSLREWLDELQAVEELVGGRGSRRSGGGPESLWGVLGQAISKISESLPDLIRALRDSGSRTIPVVRTGYAAPPMGLPPGFPMHPPAAAPGGVPGAPGVPPGFLDPQLVVKTRIVKAFVDGDNGEFIGWYLQKEAPAIYQAMKGKNLDDVKVFLGGDPILKELLGQDGIDEFLGQVLSYVNEEEPAPAETVQ